MNRSIVAIIRGENTAENIRTALDLRPWIDELAVNDQPVLVKVNLTGGSPQRRGETTTLEATDAVVRYLQSKGCRVAVCEGSSGIYSAPTNFEVGGYRRHFKEMGIACIDLSNVPSQMIYLPHANCHAPLPQLALDSKLIVSVPVPKRHFVTTLSCALKNVGVGMLARSSKIGYHGILDSLIPDVNTVLKPQLVVVDATWGLGRTGPFNGTPVKLDATIVSTDPVAADSICCAIMGLDPMSVTHLKNAEMYGVGQINPEVWGCSINDLKRVFKRALEDPFSP